MCFNMLKFKVTCKHLKIISFNYYCYKLDCVKKSLSILFRILMFATKNKGAAEDTVHQLLCQKLWEKHTKTSTKPFILYQSNGKTLKQLTMTLTMSSTQSVPKEFRNAYFITENIPYTWSVLITCNPKHIPSFIENTIKSYQQFLSTFINNKQTQKVIYMPPKVSHNEANVWGLCRIHQLSGEYWWHAVLVYGCNFIELPWYDNKC